MRIFFLKIPVFLCASGTEDHWPRDTRQDETFSSSWLYRALTTCQAGWSKVAGFPQWNPKTLRSSTGTRIRQKTKPFWNPSVHTLLQEGAELLDVLFYSSNAAALDTTNQEQQRVNLQATGKDQRQGETWAQRPSINEISAIPGYWQRYMLIAKEHVRILIPHFQLWLEKHN